MVTVSKSSLARHLLGPDFRSQSLHYKTQCNVLIRKKGAREEGDTMGMGKGRLNSDLGLIPVLSLST